MIRRTVCFYLLFSLSLSGILIPNELALAITWQPLAAERAHAPNVPGEPGAEFSNLQELAINNNGKVAFHGDLSAFSINGTGTGGIWTGSAEDLQIVAREDELAPDTNETFLFFRTKPLINNAGQVLIDGTITGDVDLSDGLWLSTPGTVNTAGSVQLLARAGVPTTSPRQIEFFSPSSLALSDNGSATFIASTDNGKTAIWHASLGNVTVVALEDSIVPAGAGLPAGTTFGPFFAPTESPKINANGSLAFQSPILNSSTSRFEDSIWTGTPGNLQLLALENAPAPGTGADFFLLTSEPAHNDMGQTAFIATLSDQDLSDSIWLGTPGNLQLLVKDGDLAPVGESGVTFGSLGFGSQLRLSNSGHVAFLADLKGNNVNFDNGNGLFITSQTGVELVARAGNAAPGMATGTVFEFFQTLSINPSGKIAFLGDVTGENVEFDQSEGIWAQNSLGELELVVRTGDWVHPLTGEVVRLADVSNPTQLEALGYGKILDLDLRSALPLSSDFGTAWNDAGQIGFVADLDHPTIGSTFFIANVGLPGNGDYDRDGDVDGNDFLAWQRDDATPTGLSNWANNYGVGNLVGATTSAPEPSAATMLLLSSWVALACQRK